MSIYLSKKRTFLQSPVVIALILCFTFGYFINLLLIEWGGWDLHRNQRKFSVHYSIDSKNPRAIFNQILIKNYNENQSLIQKYYHTDTVVSPFILQDKIYDNKYKSQYYNSRYDEMIDVTLVLIDGSNANICIEYYPKHFPCSGMEKYNCARDFVNEALNKNHIQFGDINIIPVLGLYWQFWYIDYWYLFWGVFVFLLIIIVLWVIYIVISKRRT